MSYNDISPVQINVSPYYKCPNHDKYTPKTNKMEKFDRKVDGIEVKFMYSYIVEEHEYCYHMGCSPNERIRFLVTCHKEPEIKFIPKVDKLVDKKYIPEMKNIIMKYYNKPKSDDIDIIKYFCNMLFEIFANKLDDDKTEIIESSDYHGYTIRSDDRFPKIFNLFFISINGVSYSVQIYNHTDPVSGYFTFFEVNLCIGNVDNHFRAHVAKHQIVNPNV